jgi:mRNA-degrading endonuclease toxin of MazEF toxin-antitoxin module
MASLGEIWMADFPYEDDSSQSDERPVVIVGVDGELCLCATLMITSKDSAKDHYRYEIRHWRYAGLIKKSYIRVSRKHTFYISPLHRHIGCLHQEDQINLWFKIDELYGDEISLF